MKQSTRIGQLVLRWTARMLSIVSTVVLVLFLAGEPLEVSKITARQWMGFAFFPVGLIMGFAIAWRKESLGGAITVVSLLLFYLFYLRGLGGIWAFFIFAIPGLLFLASGLLARSGRTAQAQT
jgi:hypothetical protein